MRTVILFFFIFSFLSCYKKEKQVFSIDKITRGMTSKEVKKILGEPNDSSKYLNYKKDLIIRYDYQENNFSDYGFNVIFNDSLIVTDYYYD